MDHQTLKALLTARYEWEHAEFEDQPEKEKIYQSLFDEAYATGSMRLPNLSKLSLRAALDQKYFKYRSDRRRQEMGTTPPRLRSS